MRRGNLLFKLNLDGVLEVRVVSQKANECSVWRFSSSSHGFSVLIRALQFDHKHGLQQVREEYACGVLFNIYDVEF